jgi:hypothetical protein
MQDSPTHKFALGTIDSLTHTTWVSIHACPYFVSSHTVKGAEDMIVVSGLPNLNIFKRHFVKKLQQIYSFLFSYSPYRVIRDNSRNLSRMI